MRRFMALLAVLGLLVGCEPLAAIAPKSAAGGNSAGEVTIIYTGYNRGNVQPAAPCG